MSGNQDRTARNWPQVPKEASGASIRKPSARCKTCTACRLRKVKCDGALPQCLACVNSSRRCTYPQDARCLNKPTRAELQRLEAHIDSIWDIVREKGQAEAERDNEAVPPSEPIHAEPIVQISPHHSPLVRPQAREGENAFEKPKKTYRDLSPAEIDIVGDVSPNGELVVHGVSSMHHRQKQQHGRQHFHGDSMNSEYKAKSRERQQHQQISKARLVANATFQRQRETAFLRNPSLMQQVNFGPIDPETALHLLDLHFNRLHFTYLITYRPAIMDSLITNGPYCNMVFLWGIYFTSSMFSDRPTVRAQRDHFYGLFKAALVENFDQPSIPSAVGLLLCGAALVSSGRLSAGWVNSGIAYRMILDLGCHLIIDTPRRDLPDDMALLTDIELEIRKRLYWGAYLIDATQSLYLGRPSYLRAVPARVPQDFLDTYEELEVWSPYLDSKAPISTMNAVLSTYSPRPAYAVSTFATMLGLFEISSQLVHNFYHIDSIRTPTQPIQDARAKIGDDLKHWYESRPNHLHFDPSAESEQIPPPHQITPLTTYHTLTILLHRPFCTNGYLSTHISESERSSGRQETIEAAIAIYQLIKRYKETFTLRRAPYLISYAVHSGLVAMLTLTPAERDCVLDKIGYLWEALEDLQRGGNYGLKKPMDHLRDWVSQLGFTGHQGETGRTGAAYADPNRNFNQPERGGFHREASHVNYEAGASHDKEWQKLYEEDILGNKDWVFPNSGLDGVDWLFNDISWTSAPALSDALLQSAN